MTEQTVTFNPAWPDVEGLKHELALVASPGSTAGASRMSEGSLDEILRALGRMGFGISFSVHARAADVAPPESAFNVALTWAKNYTGDDQEEFVRGVIRLYMEDLASKGFRVLKTNGSI